MIGRSAALCLLIAAFSCRSSCTRSTGSQKNPQRQAGKTAPPEATGPKRDEEEPIAQLMVSDVRIDAAAAPRDGGPLIAGEAARVSLRVRGGQPPYRIALSARGRDLAAGPALLEAELSAAPEEDAADGVEVAAKAELEPEARSGVYRVRARVIDREGREADALSPNLRVVGDGAALLPEPDSPAGLEIVDAAGRRRARFFRGERVSLRGRFAGASTAEVTVIGPSGEPLARSAELSLQDGELAMTLPVPRLARPGVYRVRVQPDRGPPAKTELKVAGAPFAPLKKLTVDHLAVYGGKDLRAVRHAELSRGEKLRVEARVGGARRRVSGEVRLRDRTAEVAFEADLGTVSLQVAAPDARVFVQGEVTIPAELAPGRYVLEIEVSENDDVSTRYREVLVR